AYALDIMLESLGAALTLAALYYYSVARETQTQRTWRWFALTLTFLFFEKYNYWLLVVLAVSATEIVQLTAESRTRVVAFVRQIAWKRALRGIASWAATTRSEVVVFIDIAPDSPDYIPMAGDYAAFSSDWAKHQFQSAIFSLS
ncbi:MAG: hypothetical protein ABI946_11060, partial [Chthoniobacterales bacterium]